MKKQRHFFHASLVGFFLTSFAHATTSVGFDVTGGVKQSGFDMTGKLDVGPQKDWETSFSFAHLYSEIGGQESRTNQFTGGVAHTFDPTLDAHLDITGWKDSINQIHYAGPTLGFTYNWKTSESDKGPDILDVTLDTDIFVYGTEVTASSTTKTIRVGRRLITTVIPPANSVENTTQLHPNLTIEKPLFDEQWTPFITAGHYFYSRDPEALENIAGQPRFALSAGHLNSMISGFLNNNGSTGFTWEIPWDLSFYVSLGASELAIDKTWATSQQVSLNRTFAECLTAKLEWDRVIEEGITTDTISGGLTYKFGSSSTEEKKTSTESNH